MTTTKKPKPTAKAATGDLNLKQQRFVHEYLIDLNGKQAAIRAGYAAASAEVTASRLLSQDKVAAAIKEAQQERIERTEITQDYVLKKISETIERCSQAEQVMVKGPNGLEPTGEWKFDAPNVLRGCELLGKHLGMFNTLKVVGDPEQPPVQVAVSAGPDFDILREALINKIGLKKT